MSRIPCRPDPVRSSILSIHPFSIVITRPRLVKPLHTPNAILDVCDQVLDSSILISSSPSTPPCSPPILLYTTAVLYATRGSFRACCNPSICHCCPAITCQQSPPPRVTPQSRSSETPSLAYNQGPPAQPSPSLTTNSHATLRLSTNTMAATVAPSQAIPPGLHPLQAAALRAAANAQQQQAQQPQQPPQRTFDDEPFDVTSRKLTLRDFVRVRTLGTGTSLVSRDLAPTRPCACRLLPSCSGTFARVCLVRPSHGTEADRSKVYALKILRKTEGRFFPLLLTKAWRESEHQC